MADGFWMTGFTHYKAPLFKLKAPVRTQTEDNKLIQFREFEKMLFLLVRWFIKLKHLKHFRDETVQRAACRNKAELF